MKQDFTSVTSRQLAALFPVLLSPHDPAWEACYAAEKALFQKRLGRQIKRINHIGSTAIPGLVAKPTIDILLEVAQDTDISTLTGQLVEEGYVVNTPPKDIILYLKGYTPRGFEGQALHIHLRHSGDWDELYFRDYLLRHPQTARAYGQLKARLKEQFAHDRDGYTAAKGDFVRKYTGLAREEFPGRYLPGE